MSLTETTLIATLKQEVKSLTSYLVDDDYTNAISDAENETGWTLPVSGDFKEYWIKDRSKRHLFFYLLSESAHKFKVKQINLQHRFEHYNILIKEMDKRFDIAKDEYPEEFISVDSANLFGNKIDAGFAYQEQTGIDITYDTEQQVIISPK